MRKLLLPLLLALASINVHAQGYHVEIIIFEHLRPATDGEIAQSGLKYPELKDSIELVGSGEAGNAFRLLSPGLYKLGGIYSRLKASSIYRPILHLAWQQPALAGDQAKYVHVRVPSLSPDAGPDALVKMDGTVRLRASRFLHADVDLLIFSMPCLNH
jgi:Protein of unknown function (DUF2803).